MAGTSVVNELHWNGMLLLLLLELLFPNVKRRSVKEGLKCIV